MMDPAAFFANLERREAVVSRRVSLTLTASQYHLAVKLAEGRNGKETRFGAGTYGGVKKGLEAHLVGVAPEIAVASALGTTVDERVFEDRGDEGVDLRTRKYGLVAVKTTTNGEEPLLRVEIEHFNEEVVTYILCYYDPAREPMTVSVIGWASKDEVRQAEQRQLVRGGPRNIYITLKGRDEQWLTGPTILSLLSATMPSEC
jgi:hypothetical protein